MHIKNPVNTLVLALRLSALMEVLHSSCNMGTHDLPDMYGCSPQALGIHIRQITHAHVTTIRYIPCESSFAYFFSRFMLEPRETVCKNLMSRKQANEEKIKNHEASVVTIMAKCTP